MRPRRGIELGRIEQARELGHDARVRETLEWGVPFDARRLRPMLAALTDALEKRFELVVDVEEQGSRHDFDDE